LIVGTINESKFDGISFKLTKFEFSSLNPQELVLLRSYKQPTVFKVIPRSLASDLMYVPDEHLIFNFKIPLSLSHFFSMSSLMGYVFWR